MPSAVKSVFLSKGASREIDRLVAEKFLGHDVVKIKQSYIEWIPFYSSNFDDAWQIIMSVRVNSESRRNSFYHNLKLRIFKRCTALKWHDISYEEIFNWITPLDIALAALDTVGHTVEKAGKKI